MEQPPNTEQVLQDLALIYIALAHSTDENLSDAESDTIAERLQSWQADASDEALEQAVENALKTYVREDADDHVNRAAYNIGENVPRDLRQFILDDLMDIALADGKFLHTEGSFIGELATAWDVHPKRQDEVTPRSWSILNDGERQGNWTPVHDLALIYLTMAHRTDDRLSGSEVEAITTKLGEWLPDANWDDVLQVVKDALKVYVQEGQGDATFEESVQSIEQAVPEHQRAALLEDLRYVSHADGEVIEEEAAMIERLSKAWDLPSGPPEQEK